MKKTIITAFLSSLFLFIACKRDKDEVIKTPAYLKQMLPYENGQTVRFRSTGGITLEAVVTIRSRFNSQSACQGCEATSVESIAYDFKVENNRFIDIGIDNRPIIFLSIWSPADNFQIGSGLDFLTEEGVAQPVCDGPRQTCLPSIVLNGTTYNNVLEIKNGNEPDKVTRAYYVVSKGLVGFAYGNGLTYNLVN